MGNCFDKDQLILLPGEQNPLLATLPQPAAQIQPQPHSSTLQTPAQSSTVPQIKQHTRTTIGSSRAEFETAKKSTPQSVTDTEASSSQGTIPTMYVGLDFGTVYSTIGVWREGKVTLMDLQGTNRILSIVEAREDKGKYAKEAMQLYAPRGQNILFELKSKLYRNEKIPEHYVGKFLGFMKDLVHDSRLNEAVVCLPGCYKGESMVKLRSLLQQQFQHVVFISDIVAVFLCHLYERKIELKSSNDATTKCGVISFGGGFLSCGQVVQKGAKVVVGVTGSAELGGEKFVQIVQDVALRNAGLSMSAAKAPGRFWYQCMNKMELLHDARIVEIDDLPVLFGCSQESVEVSWTEFYNSNVIQVLAEAKKIVAETIPPEFSVLISGGMCRFPPFRDWLEERFSSRVTEMFNMSTACAIGTTVAAGLCNQIHIRDIEGFDDLRPR